MTTLLAFSDMATLIGIVGGIIVFIVWGLIDEASLTDFFVNGGKYQGGTRGKTIRNKRTKRRRRLEKKLGLPLYSLYGADDYEMDRLENKHLNK